MSSRYILAILLGLAFTDAACSCSEDPLGPPGSNNNADNNNVEEPDAGFEDAGIDFDAGTLDGGYSEVIVDVEVGPVGLGVVRFMDGNETFDCEARCERRYDVGSNSIVQFEALANENAIFTGWAGDCADSNANPCALRIDGTQDQVTVIAEFAPQMATVDVRFAEDQLPPPGVNVTSTPPGIDCPAGNCSADFVRGSVVTLTASGPDTLVPYNWSNCDFLDIDERSCRLVADGRPATEVEFEEVYLARIGLRSIGPLTSTISWAPEGRCLHNQDPQGRCRECSSSRGINLVQCEVLQPVGIIMHFETRATSVYQLEWLPPFAVNPNDSFRATLSTTSTVVVGEVWFLNPI